MLGFFAGLSAEAAVEDMIGIQQRIFEMATPLRRVISYIFFGVRLILKMFLFLFYSFPFFVIDMVFVFNWLFYEHELGTKGQGTGIVHSRDVI